VSAGALIWPPRFDGNTKGVHHIKVVLGLPDAVIATQAGWSERAVAKIVQTYAHAVDERRLDEMDAAFDRGQRDADRDANPPRALIPADLNQLCPSGSPCKAELFAETACLQAKRYEQSQLPCCFTRERSLVRNQP
jgi:hypothetical protein